MIVSLDWLSDYVDLPEVDVLAERLLLSGLNHESTKTVDSDTAVDLEVTSNRPDCLGHIGIAREVSVLFQRPLKIPTAQVAGWRSFTFFHGGNRRTGHVPFLYGTSNSWCDCWPKSGLARSSS